MKAIMRCSGFVFFVYRANGRVEAYPERKTMKLFKDRCWKGKETSGYIYIIHLKAREKEDIYYEHIGKIT